MICFFVSKCNMRCICGFYAGYVCFIRFTCFFNALVQNSFDFGKTFLKLCFRFALCILLCAVQENIFGKLLHLIAFLSNSARTLCVVISAKLV